MSDFNFLIFIKLIALLLIYTIIKNVNCVPWATSKITTSGGVGGGLNDGSMIVRSPLTPSSSYNYSFQHAQNYTYEYQHVYPIVTRFSDDEREPTVQSTIIGPPVITTSNFQSNAFSEINYETQTNQEHKKYTINSTSSILAPNHHLQSSQSQNQQQPPPPPPKIHQQHHYTVQNLPITIQQQQQQQQQPSQLLQQMPTYQYKKQQQQQQQQQQHSYENPIPYQPQESASEEINEVAALLLSPSTTSSSSMGFSSSATDSDNTFNKAQQLQTTRRPAPPPLLHYANANDNEQTYTDDRECLLFDIPINGSVSLDIYPDVNLIVGDYIANQRKIIYKCDDAYQIVFPSGSTGNAGISGNVGTSADTNTCVNGKWSQVTPVCEKAFCTSDHFKSITNQVECRLPQQQQNSIIDCDRATNGVIANIACAQGYRKPNENLPNTLKCGANMEWNLGGYRCEDICGLNKNPSTSYFPWQVRIYNNGQSQQQICSGTILNANVILSAANCFQIKNNRQSNTFLHRDLFTVIVGGFTQKSPIQILKIEKIFSPDLSTTGGGGGVGVGVGRQSQQQKQQYQNDVAILILKNSIIFTEFIAPVCIGYESFFTTDQNSNVIGKLPIIENRRNNAPAIQKIIDVQLTQTINGGAGATANNKQLSNNSCGKGHNVNTTFVHNGTGFVVPFDNVYYLRGIYNSKLNDCLLISNLKHFIISISKHSNQNRPV